MITPELGVCYYPEHWPEDKWELDAAKMRATGLSWVRIGEFAWSRIEPTEGKYEWTWLDRAIEVLGNAGLKIVLGTPSATPPRWMVDKHPDMLAVDKNGRPRKFGSRRHYCFSHLKYREEAVQIAEKLGERYGSNPHIAAWQIDNEYGCHDTTVSYSPSAKTAFQEWLENKYETIDALNTAWGNVFWSLEYVGFAQIDLPNLTVTEPNPAHVMDFRRFSSDQVAAFNRVQCAALRKYTDQPLIHNYMGRITDFDHFAVGDDLEIASWDSYPLGFLEDRSDQGDTFKREFMRQGDPDFQAFHHDLYRAVGKGRWWVMEQQPGPVNWAPYNPAPLPGMVRLWTWEAIAHGAEVVSYFRWRQAPFAQEQMHSGLQRPDGEWAQGAEEVSRVSDELSQLPQFEHKKAQVALVFDYPSAWAWETQKQGKDFDYFRLVYDFYRGLRRLGLSVDILPSTTTDFGDRKMVIIPGLFAWTDELKAAIKKYKGQLVLGPRTGSKTNDFQIPATLPPRIPDFECKISSVESLRPDANIALEKGGYFQIWREHAETGETISEETSDGHPALITSANKTYLAGWPDDEAMTRILSEIAQIASLETETMSEGVRRRELGDMTLYTNYGTRPAVLENTIVNGRKFRLGAGQIQLIDNETKESLLTSGRG